MYHGSQEICIVSFIWVQINILFLEIIHTQFLDWLKCLCWLCWVQIHYLSEF